MFKKIRTAHMLRSLVLFRISKAHGEAHGETNLPFQLNRNESSTTSDCGIKEIESDYMSFRHLVRIKSTDLEGHLPVSLGLSKISGVNRRLAETIVNTLNIPSYERIGSLTDATIKEIENIISDPIAAGIPKWMVNRRKDRQTGDDIHITEAQLILQTKQDIERYIRIRSRRGIRHSFKLKVRGQKTRTHGGRGTTVGVQKKKKR